MSRMLYFLQHNMIHCYQKIIFVHSLGQHNEMLPCCANQYIMLISKMGFLMGAADFAILTMSKWGLAYRIYKPAIWGI